MKWIHSEIEARGGAIPFDEFMELALYHPVHGYYSGGTARYGRAGDFLTAPTASEWYPRVFSRVIAAIASSAGGVELVDLAAGDGSFLAGVLDALGTRARELIEEVVLVERSDAMRAVTHERFADTAIPVTTVEELEPGVLGGNPTVLHASELYDALPVVRVVARAAGLRELWVAASGAELAWEERSARAPVADYFAGHGVELTEGQFAEANLAAAGTHRHVLRSAASDAVSFVLDYGYEAARLYDPRGRRFGSISTFSDHQVGRDPLVSPGKVDLTAHVNWGDLRSAAVSEGWQEIGLWPLAEFLVRAGIAVELEERGFGMEAEMNADTVVARQEVKRLLDPEGMGSDLKVLVQAKGTLIPVAETVLSFEF